MIVAMYITGLTPLGSTPFKYVSPIALIPNKYPSCFDNITNRDLTVNVSKALVPPVPSNDLFPNNSILWTIINPVSIHVITKTIIFFLMVLFSKYVKILYINKTPTRTKYRSWVYTHSNQIILATQYLTPIENLSNNNNTKKKRHNMLAVFSIMPNISS